VAVKVFVSSTYIDLKDHRQRVITQLHRAGYHVDPMEDWTSAANEPRQFSLERLDGCQACVLLVGFRRGFVPPGHTRSITQMEYDHARACGIDVLPFLLDDGVTGWPEPYDDRTTDPLLKEWREALGLRHGVERFTADPTSVDVLPALIRWQARQYEREQMKDAGFIPAAQFQIPSGGDFILCFGDTHRSNPASRNRRAMIEKVWAIWITGVLQPSLPEDILLELGLTEQPAMVTRALDLLVQPDLADRVLTPGTRLIEVFDRLDRALLILGAPGTGKTTLLLTLARDLLQRAAQDQAQPIPVVFPLSSWAAQRRPMALWLVDELQQRYDVPRTIGQAWVDADQVLPLLDGLDEVQAEHRVACADAINTFRQEHGLLPLAVCSRITEYEALAVRLRLQGAVVVQPLTRPQVDSYLAQVGQPVAAVRAALQEDPLLWELLDTPLMLTVVTLAYAGQPVEGLRTGETLAERQQSLFTTYVNRMVQRRSAVTCYPRPQTEHWLAWLARQMTQHSQTVFYLERLQPDWLPVGRHWLSTQGARLLAGLVGGLLAGLVGGLVTMLADTLAASLTGSLMEALMEVLIGALIGIVAGYSREITPIETVRWSWPKFFSETLLPSRRSLRSGLGILLGTALCFGVILGLLVGETTGLGAGLGAGLSGALFAGLGIKLVASLGALLGTVLFAGLLVGMDAELGARLGASLTVGLASGLTVGLVFGLTVGLVYKLYAGLVAGLSGGEIATKTIPNEGIHRSIWVAVSSGLVSGLGVTLVVGLVNGLGVTLSAAPSDTLSSALAAGISYGSLVGLATGLKYGGRACLQHLVLRLSLWYYDFTPRRYVDFLDYAAERLFLRKVGGGYIFIHRLLQDHFATMYQSGRADSPLQPPTTPP
jgi:DNA polymerase III delta prime subunit